jgi:hypothetical protein
MTTSAINMGQKHRAQNAVVAAAHRMLSVRVYATLNTVSVSMAVLAINHCRRNGIGLSRTVLNVSMARKAFDLFASGVHFMKFDTCCLFVFGETVTIQAHRFRHPACLLNLPFVARILATCLIRNKFRMVNRHQSTLDNLVWHFMTIQAGRLNQFLPIFTGLEKVACEAHFFVDAEVFGALIMAVTCAAGNFYAINRLCHMPCVSKPNAAEVNLR